MKILGLIFLVFHLISTVNYAQKIVAGGRHSLIICEDQTVQSWGYNGYGQLGTGNLVEHHSGQQVIGMSNVKAVAAGLFHSIFIKNDGTVWTCGRNTLGPLGNGNNSDQLIPVQIIGLSDIIQGAGGGEHSLFLKADGTVFSCGLNSSGQLGDGNNSNKNIPVKLNGLTNIVQVAAGAEFSLFLENDGSVWACGHNGYGQFGNATNTSSKIPIKINNLSDISYISAGEWHSIFVKKDGTVFTSGRNQYGQLGDGTTNNNLMATQISSLSNVIQAEAGGIHSVFVKSDGTVWSCGLNSGGNNDGQLGDGTTIDRLIPVQVISSWTNGNIICAEATREHSLYLKNDGQVWASGRNNYGQLGYGSFTNLNSSISVHSNKICSVLLSSLNQNQLKNQIISYFPNPTSSYINLHSTKELTDASINIYNTFGKSIQQINSIQGKEITIFSDDLPRGIYFLQLMEDQNIISNHKIIITNP
ncbi:MAG: T9SS type A sorting domain-containing protein [Saprospiraceae bacterium]|nr:T9SS type A sorting domain-containing protein [Saprospiraceae bacterium]